MQENKDFQKDTEKLELNLDKLEKQPFNTNDTGFDALMPKNFSSKKKKASPFPKNNLMNSDLLQKIAQKTVRFIKKNEFIKIDFVLVLKFSVVFLIIEYLIYLGLQLCFALIPNLADTVLNAPIAVPIVVASIYALSAILILIFQLKKNKIFIIILKCLEFITFGLSLGKPLIHSIPLLLATGLHLPVHRPPGQLTPPPDLGNSNKIATFRRINLILMIVVLFLIITSSMVLFLVSLKWYYSMSITIFLIFQILVLNYESKIIMDRRIVEERPGMLHQTLMRTFSRVGKGGNE